ncbi:LOW QUALITY PROTEIN: hypothetical protein Cgig2_011253 [Carnegiea gigantea]|uniref:Uncharacterized protein n=1 Tax=Carnegiea gigantea TaxID=171969 RepID=A0A9Q1KG52_9CARY|nr:LOW QUALITY PROTEIN: hypothetical protein Cgig2_011253 [Carnegiea gigantea]
MNKIQPSQLVEERRNAARPLKKLKTKIQTTLSLHTVTEKDVEDTMEEIGHNPLPLLGAMIEKFPNKFEPANWWPSKRPSSNPKSSSRSKNMNRWNQELEEQMREIVGVIKRKDMEIILGNKALKLNKTLALLGSLLTGIAAIRSSPSGHDGPLAGVVATVAVLWLA